MNVESYFITQMSQKKSRIGDDGAVVEKWIYSKDLFFENVHFKRNWLSSYQIGYKAMMVNLSDAIAMNAVPHYALVGVAMPTKMSLSDRQELARGMRTAADEFGVEIIGGDTIGNTKIDLSITIISHSDHPLTRKGMKIGDTLAFTGNLGKSLRHLRYLMSGGKVHTKSRFVTPQLRADFIRQGRLALRCGMDISDGLLSDIQKLTALNHLGLRWDKKFKKTVGCSGEEYEMLIAFDSRHTKKLQKIAQRTKTPLTLIGTACRGKVVNRCKTHHF